jgi:hypothetical protein
LRCATSARRTARIATLYWFSAAVLAWR